MKIKKFKSELKQQSFDIPDIDDKIKQTASNQGVALENQPPIYQRKSRRALLFGCFITIFLCLAIAIIGVTSRQVTHDKGFATVDTTIQLRHILKDNKTYQKEPFSLGKLLQNMLMFMSCAAKGKSDGTTSPAPGEEGISHTNQQVNGIDEPDIIKQEDHKIYFVMNQTLYIVAVDNGNMTLIHSFYYEDMSESVDKPELYITEKYIFLMYTSVESNDYTAKNDLLDLYYRGNLTHKIMIYQKTEAYPLVKELEMYGVVADTRLHDNVIYIVNNLLINETMVDVLPRYLEDQTPNVIDLHHVNYVNQANNFGYTMIFTIDLQDEVIVDHMTQLGICKSDTIYMNQTYLYITSSIYNGKKKVNETTIYQYKIEGIHLALEGTITIDGTILNQYSIDEYAGFVRIVATNTYAQRGQLNGIYIFDTKQIDENHQLKLIGSLTQGIGEDRQTVRSVRFNQNFVQIVTYEQKDPLYNVDISNPATPQIIGVLKAPGYSAYLHAFTDTITLGMGYLDDNRTHKLSLYQKNENGESIQIGNDFILDDEAMKYYDSAVFLSVSIEEAIYHPRAIFVMNDRLWIGFSVLVQLRNRSYYDYWLLELHPENEMAPIQVKNIFTGFRAAEPIKNDVVRMVYQDGYFYVLSSNYLTSYTEVVQKVECLPLRSK